MIDMTLAHAANCLRLNRIQTEKAFATSAQLALNTGGLDVAMPIFDFPAEIKDTTSFHGISINSREISPGNLFVALKGDKFDGHDFVEHARQNGATAALVSRKVKSALPQLIVDDCVSALGKLAENWRNQFQIPIIAVTGSNGKTTLKNMLAAILMNACQMNPEFVLFTPGTLNNHLGLPLTLANLNKQHRYAVVEMGMNHFGEIAYLTKITRPHVAIITNAAAAHLSGVGSLSGVAQAKSEIFLGLETDGTAILNRDDAFYTFWRAQIGNRPYLTFGFHPDADVSLQQASSDPTHPIPFRTPVGPLTVRLNLLGQHNILNALAATAAMLAIGIEREAIQTGLASVKPAPGRLQLYTLPNEIRIIDDTYNANPFSLKAAVATLSSFLGKKIFVMGDMKELGDDEIALHHEAGSELRDHGIDHLFTFGHLSAHTAQTFGENAIHFEDKTKLIKALKPLLQPQTTVLVKGSRSMKMEQVVAELLI